MRQLIGALIALLGLAFIAFLILWIWDISPVGWKDLLRSGATVGLIGGALVFLVIIRFVFFRRSTQSRPHNETFR